MKRYQTEAGEYLAGVSNLTVALGGALGTVEALNESFNKFGNGRVAEGLGFFALCGASALLSWRSGGSAGIHFARAPYTRRRAELEEDMRRLAVRSYHSSPNTWGLPVELWPKD